MLGFWIQPTEESGPGGEAGTPIWSQDGASCQPSGRGRAGNTPGTGQGRCGGHPRLAQSQAVFSVVQSQSSSCRNELMATGDRLPPEEQETTVSRQGVRTKALF